MATPEFTSLYRFEGEVRRTPRYRQNPDKTYKVSVLAPTLSEAVDKVSALFNLGEYTYAPVFESVKDVTFG